MIRSASGGSRLLWVLLLVFLWAWPISPGFGETLTLEVFLDRVLERNPDLESSFRDLRALYQSTLLAVTHQRPSLGLRGAGWTLSGGDRDGYGYLQVALTQAFDLAGRYPLQERRALLAYAAGAAEHAEKVNVLLGEAEAAYWAAYMARLQVVLDEELLRQRRESLRIVEEKFRLELVPRLDVIRAAARLEQQRSLLVRAQADLKDAAARMAALAGGEAVMPVEGDPLVPRRKIDLDFARARKQRPDLIRLARQVELRRVEGELAAKGLAPLLDGSLGYTALADPEAAAMPDRGEVVFRLDLTVPLSDGGRTRADRARAEELLRSAESSLEAAEASLMEEMELARSRWARAEALERSAGEQVSQAEEELRITRLMYEEGLGSQLDLITAQAEQQRARTEHLAAVKEMYLALVDMRRAMGLYVLDALDLRRDREALGR